MRRRSRLPRVAKWGGVMVCGLLIAVAVVNLRYTVICALPDGSGLGSGSGVVGVAWRYWAGRGMGVIMEEADEWRFWPPLIVYSDPSGLIIAVPIWFLLLMISIPTIVLWRLDHSPAPGHCPCGYDLRGNVSGTCPECGREAAAESG